MLDTEDTEAVNTIRAYLTALQAWKTSTDTRRLVYMVALVDEQQEQIDGLEAQLDDIGRR